MNTSRFAVTVVALWWCLSSTFTHAQNLTIVKSAATLPTGRHRMVLLYDREDSIYLFGGKERDGPLYDVMKYSISKDTLEHAGQLPYKDSGGSAVMNKFKNMFYLSGRGGNDIQQYFPCNNNSFVYASSFGDQNYLYGIASPDVDTALLFGGQIHSERIMSLDLNNLESEQIAEFPYRVTYPGAIWVEEKGVAYIFDHSRILKYFRSNNTIKELPLRMPIRSNSYPVVWDGRFAYLIAEASEGNPIDSLLQFDPTTETIGLVPVEGYVPLGRTTAVYAENVNRIYRFGGYTFATDHGDPEVYHDEIYYIDLSP